MCQMQDVDRNEARRGKKYSHFTVGDSKMQISGASSVNDE